MSKVMREQHDEMQNTFVMIRQKIVEAQREIRKHNEKTRQLEEEKVEPDQRYEVARARCTALKQEIAERERDLFDAENQIPSAKSKMHELGNMYGENIHFKKSLERTRQDLEETEKSRAKSNDLAKEKSEDCWQAKQKLHKLELLLEDVEKKLEFNMRRIMVAREKIAIAHSQSNLVSQNYDAMSKVDLEAKFDDLQEKVDQAKRRRKAIEEKEIQLTWTAEELEKQVKYYYAKMSEMFSGQRELASSKLL